jgi:hypothetical protein
MPLPVFVVAVEQYCCKLSPNSRQGRAIRCKSGTTAFAHYLHRAFRCYPSRAPQLQFCALKLLFTLMLTLPKWFTLPLQYSIDN